MEINACTSVQIDVGCPVATGATGCAPTWVYGTPQDSWGRQFRTVQFDQHVQDGAFIRITTCAKSSCSDCIDCGLGAVDTEGAYSGANKLLKYLVDGQDITRYLTAVLALEPVGAAHVDGCVYVGCAERTNGTADPTVGCCSYGATGFDSLAQIPWGSEVTVGPIGARSFIVGSG